MAAYALEVHRYRVAKYIGAYAAAMNGVDAIALQQALVKMMAKLVQKSADI